MKTRIILLIIICTLVGSSCNEDLLNKEIPNNFTRDTYYTTAEELSTALTGVYAILQSTNLISREWFFLHDLRSDEMASGGGQLETPRNQLLIGSHSPNNAVLTSVWTELYRLIHRANGVITKSANITMDEPLKKRYLGEARFLRAWAYFQLLEFWGGVPLYTTYATSIFDAKARSSETEIYNFIVSELTAIQADLPAKFTGDDLGRVSAMAAKTMLAKVYLFNTDYASAQPLLEEVKDYGEANASGGNPLMDNYFDNFIEESEYNKESIWEVSYTSAGNYNWDADGNTSGPNDSWIRSQEYSAIGWRNIIPSNKLLAEYEDNDPRLKNTFFFTGDTYGDPASPKVLTDGDQRGDGSVFKGVPQKISWKKYSVMYKLDPGGFFDKIGINYRMMRYADIYLMLAEVENEIGTPAQAITYLNKTRERPSVDMPLYPTADYPTGTKDQIMRAIMHERMVEFAGEEIRNYDILRWRKANKFTVDPISYYDDKYERLPIPQAEIDANQLIEQDDQNAGY
jgi:hypothetical protein